MDYFDLLFNFNTLQTLIQPKQNYMRKFIFSALILLTPFLSHAQQSGLSEIIDSGFKKYTQWFVNVIFYEIPFTEQFKVPWVVIVLIGGAIYFTFYFRLINFSAFGTAIKVVRGDFQDIEDHGAETLYEKTEGKVELKKADGEVTHFQALSTALSATVGLGNIAGVGVAISIGGPGATFWMIIGGLLGMATKFAECTLGVKYREVGHDGTIYGGPMYYLRNGLAQKGYKKLGRVMGFIFAVLVTGGAFGIGNMFQANQASVQFASLFGWQDSDIILVIGAILALIVALVIVGGIKRIAKVAETLVPFMAVLYFISASVVILMNYQYIGTAFGQIFNGAFTGAGITGGVAGVMIQGFRRSTFSNEAGIGSAPIAHSAVRTRYPASEGVVALLEPFIDTVVICTMTALVIIISNVDGQILHYGQEITEGVRITALAFDSTLPNFSIALTIAVILFAISTMISWSYYGLQGFMYLFGRSERNKLVYNIVFCIFIWIGSAISLDAVIDFSDAMIYAMAVPNIIGVILLAPVIKKEVKRYYEAINLKRKVMDQ